jgi:hypothetical protein
VKCFAVSRLQVTVEVMMARPDNLIAQVRAHAATATMAVSMLLISAAAGWPQAASPHPAVQDSGGAQQQAQQSVPAQVGTAPSSVVPVREEDRSVIDEIGKIFEKFPTLKSPQETIEDLNARARSGKGRLRQPVAPGEAILHGLRTHDMPNIGQRRAGLQDGRR